MGHAGRRGRRRRHGRRRLRLLRGPCRAASRGGRPGPGRRRHHRRRRGQPARLRQGAGPRARPGAALPRLLARSGAEEPTATSSSRPRAAWSWRRAEALGALEALAGRRSARPASRRSTVAARRAPRLRAAPGPRPRRRRVLPAGRPGAADAGRGRSCVRAARRPRRAPCAHRCRGHRLRARRRAVGGVAPTGGDIRAAAVVNAAGTWAGEVAALAGVPLPILPRRGFILVTEPLPPLVRHKVYAADYVADVASDDGGAADLAGRRGHPVGHRPHRREPRTGRLRPDVLAAGAAPAGGAGDRAVPGAWRTSG